jgi:hypothetical protein
MRESLTWLAGVTSGAFLLGATLGAQPLVQSFAWGLMHP